MSKRHVRRLLMCATVAAALVAPPAAVARTTCTKASTGQVVTAFVVALNGADAGLAVRRWAPEPAFQWYSTSGPGARLNAAALDRRTLRAYFAARVGKREHLRRLRFIVHLDRRRMLGHFYGAIRRSADDLRPSTYSYKGAVDCSSGRPLLIVWSMSRTTSVNSRRSRSRGRRGS